MHLHRLYEGSEAWQKAQKRPPDGPGLNGSAIHRDDMLEEWRPDPHDVARDVVWRLMRNGVAVFVVSHADESPPRSLGHGG